MFSKNRTGDADMYGEVSMMVRYSIQLLESPIPAPAAPPSQKASSDDISGTKRGTVDPLVSKRPEKNSEKES